MFFDKSGIMDELELGDRAATWQLVEEFNALFSPEDRPWLAVLDCYAKVVQALGPEHPESVRWRPRFDEHGRWVMPS